MTTHAPDGRHRAGDWDVYWRGTAENAAHRQGGPQEPVLAAFWGRFFTDTLPSHEGMDLLDLACGNGAVTGYARAPRPELISWCCDYSGSALGELQKRHPGSHCVVADALRSPFADNSFAIVASQFGVEYAGPDAIATAGRLVATDGWLALVLHLRDGAIYRECAANRGAADAIRASGVLTLARKAFDAGFALNAGTGTIESFKAAERAFTPAVRRLEDILREWGPSAADGLPRQLYQDIANMYQRMSAYEPGEVMAWLQGMTAELDAYVGRMTSMLEAAVDEPVLAAQCSALKQLGFETIETGTLAMGENNAAAAWRLVARRSAG